ncbi:ketopantoate reductase family protein [Psychrilyobacter atlanticus]|uniref:ketopantoate reductase family protein n=1 Tax=Psychrilyobacter atlanticus TaxID=271091 RepID=UPI001469E0FC|nr:2-dehydropantoate 2-reductase [Psychrilyobacter atlanticus]
MGAGAMGCLFGGLLRKAGEEVWLVDPWKEHMDKVKKEGLLMSDSSGDEYIDINATVDPKEVGTVDFVILLSKSNYLSKSIREALPMIDEDTTVLALQNGLGNVEIISEVVDNNQIMFGICEVGSDLKGPGHIKCHLLDGVIKIKPLNGTVDHKVENIVNTFAKSGVNAILSMDVEEDIWGKLAINGCFNAACALTRLKAGDFIGHNEGMALVEDILREIVAVARAKKISLDYDKIMGFIKIQLPKVGAHYPSMAQDAMNKRLTEIESINGAVAKEGKKFNVPVPVNETIVKLMSIIQNSYELQF